MGRSLDGEDLCGQVPSPVHGQDDKEHSVLTRLSGTDPVRAGACRAQAGKIDGSCG